MINIVKIGGNVIDDSTELEAFLKEFSSIPGKKILVHGGGKEASRLLTEMGIQVKMIDGRRVTDNDTLKVVVMVYAGVINKRIVSILQKDHCNAIGLSGADGNLLHTEKRSPNPIDFGYVGDITSDEAVNTHLLMTLLDNGYTPVICAITHNGEGQLLNTNADTVASAVAIGLSKEDNVTLNMCFELKGVMTDLNSTESILHNINISEVENLISTGIISGGMIPKIKNAANVVRKGVGSVNIINHRDLKYPEQGTTIDI